MLGVFLALFGTDAQQSVEDDVADLVALAQGVRDVVGDLGEPVEQPRESAAEFDGVIGGRFRQRFDFRTSPKTRSTYSSTAAVKPALFPK